MDKTVDNLPPGYDFLEKSECWHIFDPEGERVGDLYESEAEAVDAAWAHYEAMSRG